jgi:hypothetical protein
VLCLKDVWKSLRVPAVVKGALKDKGDAGARARSKPLKPGLKTPPDAFRYPILEALNRLEGAGRVGDVFRVLEEILSEQLNTYDYQPLPSDPNSVRWRSSAHRARYEMVQEGLLADDSPRGVWEINDAGREALKHAKDNPDMQRKLFGGAESD